MEVKLDASPSNLVAVTIPEVAPIVTPVPTVRPLENPTAPNPVSLIILLVLISDIVYFFNYLSRKFH